jgi:mono/diheme cytochrome c family protein
VKAILIFLVLAGTAGAGVVWLGLYDISATDQHLPPTYRLIELTMRRSVERRGRDIAVPPLGEPAQLAQGLALYRSHCEQCHGAPGVAPAPFALGLTPLPAPLAQTGREWPPGELFWVVKHGIKMTGMPAWKFRLTDEEIWALVAFMLRRLPFLSPAEYRALPAPRIDRKEPGPEPPSAQRGRTALQQYACVGCHRIPGLTGPDARVGPPLAGIASRLMLGGVLPNSPENMARWIRAPKDFDPRTAMPDLGVSEAHARDMVAYLYTLE